MIRTFSVKNNPRHMVGTWIMFVCLILFLALLISIFASQNILSVTHYEYSSEKITSPFTAVQITDLHNHEFGENNHRLVQKIVQEKPDVIFMTGDILMDDEERTDIVETLIEELVQIAPVYYSLGNHEDTYIRSNPELIEKLEKAGAVVLEQEYLDTIIKGQEVRIGGVYGYVMSRYYGDGSEQRFMKEFEDTERLKILLSHIPEGLLLWESMKQWDVDMIFSGHVHGGQVRIPVLGGLFDPEEGFFPTYTKGQFSCGGSVMTLSAGLGNSSKVPRINNLPEIVVCRFMGKNTNRHMSYCFEDVENIGYLPGCIGLLSGKRQYERYHYCR